MNQLRPSAVFGQIKSLIYPLLSMQRDIVASSMSPSGSSFDEGEYSWISYFCSLKGNEFYCEVDHDYIRDRFNLKGLERIVSNYQMSLHIILDLESYDDLTEDQQDILDAEVATLYGMIHARFILTRYGQYSMYEKLRAAEFGRCPRLKCQNQPVLPVGLFDTLKKDSVKLFCPSCKDVFQPVEYAHHNIDGAHFGTTFPHMFLLEMPELMPSPPNRVYVPRVFGYELNSTWLEASIRTKEAALNNRKVKKRK